MEKIVDSIVDDSIEEIEKADLIEEIDEIDEFFGEQNTPAAIIQPPLIKRLFVGVAVVLILFSIIGVIFSVWFVHGFVTDIKGRKALKEELALFVYPVVINDPPTFDSVDNLSDSTIINGAIWKIILTEDKSNFDTDIGAIYIPAINVDAAAHSIFGISPTEHGTVSSSGFRFIYNDQTKTYEIPENPHLFSYSPLITSVTNVGELYTVTVDYMQPAQLAIAGIEQDNKPIKTMIYTISRTRDKKTIDSIQNITVIE